MRVIQNVMAAGLLAAALPLGATANAIVVPDDQPTIQDAVDAAVEGDTIQVRAGTYVEEVRIQGAAKNGLVIEPAEGDRPVVEAPIGMNAFWIKHADRVQISSLELHGGTAGVRLDY